MEPALYETERTLATLVKQQQKVSSNIRNIPSIHIWGDRLYMEWTRATIQDSSLRWKGDST